MQRFDDSVKSYLGFLDNEYVSATLSIVLILYAGLAAPRLPEQVAMWFDNILVKLVVFFLIAYTGRKNPTVAAIAAVGLMVTLQTVNRYFTNKKMEGAIQQVDKKREGFADQTTNNQVPSTQPPVVASEESVDGSNGSDSEVVCVPLDPNAKHYHQYARSNLDIYHKKDSDSVNGWDGRWDDTNPDYARVSE